MKCAGCTRELTDLEINSPSSVVHTCGDPCEKKIYCGVCMYTMLNPEDYGKPTFLGKLRVMWKRKHGR